MIPRESFPFPQDILSNARGILEKTVLSNRLPTFVCRNSGVTIWGFIRVALGHILWNLQASISSFQSHLVTSFVGDCRCAETKTLAVRKLWALQLSSKSYQFTIIKQLLQLIFFRELDDGFSVLSTAVPRGFSCHTRASRVQLYSGVFQLSSVVQRRVGRKHVLLELATICEHVHEFHTSSTAQGGGGSFKQRKTIGEIGCCESRMSEQKHWPTD